MDTATKQPSQRSIYEINTRVWLHELSQEIGRRATLSDVPDSTLDHFAHLGFAWIWLLGVWTTGAVGRRISATHPGWRRTFEDVLGNDLREEDICGSPFAVKEYVVHPDFGGDAALDALRVRLQERGLRLLLDFVPNHTARDHPWATEHPEFYVHGTEQSLADDPDSFCRMETAAGTRVLAYGRDPGLPAWSDTLQLNYRHPVLREAMREQLSRVAARCDGVRCDMAMLILPNIFNATWGALSQPADGRAPVDTPFWPEAIASVRRQRPEFTFLAEVYWDLEYALQQQGFDFTYDKRLYDRLLGRNAAGIRSHLLADIGYQRKLVRFLENHDEMRAAGAFPPEVHQAAAVVAFLLPGLRLVHEGQLEGRKVHVPIHLGRRPAEPVDPVLKEFYDGLLRCTTRTEVQSGRWQLLECRPARPGDETWRQFLCFSWDGQDGGRLLVAVNYAPQRGQCLVGLPFTDLPVQRVRLEDLLSSAESEQEGEDLAAAGLPLDMPPWGHHVFTVDLSEPVPPPPVPGFTLRGTLRGHRGVINRIAWSPDGRKLASASNDGTIRIWDPGAGTEIACVEKDQRTLSVAWSPDGGKLASAGADRGVRIWNADPFREERLLSGHRDWVNSVCWLPGSDSRLISGSADNTARLWDLASGKHRSLPHRNNVFCVACSPDGNTIASACADNTVRLWRSETGEPGPVLHGHTQQVLSVAWSPDGKALVSASTDDTARVWDPGEGRLIRVLELHTNDVRAAVFSPDGSLLATKGADGRVVLWRCETWQAIARLPEPCGDDWLPGLAFHPRLPVLATLGDRDRAIRIWDLDRAILLGQPAAATVTCTSVKIILVGESNTGKSCLAMRIAEDRYPSDKEQVATHGMRLWPVAPERLGPAAVAPAGERRDIVLWDMGGQSEYQLVNQLFLRDAALVLVLFDPTRGSVAFREVETWNKWLEKQLRDRPAVKLLIGAKLDQPSDTIDRGGLERLLREGGFAAFHEVSALTNRGVPEVREAMAKAIHWDRLSRISRPELFQRIRDEIEIRRKRGEVVLHVADLHRALGRTPPTEDETQAVRAVADQLAMQGIIACSHVTTGEPVLVLQVQEIERYAGSLILAARSNPRGVPALELRAIPQPDFVLPGIPERQRLPRGQERTVLECTVVLLLEHGICFEHEGLLIFPTLFPPAPQAAAAPPKHAVSLYYDFSGAIDNVYASLIALLDRDFSRVRLEADQAEFDVEGGGLCGLCRVDRPGGFAHMDVYFESQTPRDVRDRFIDIVEQHLHRYGVEVQERLEMTCSCGQRLDEETIRRRIDRGYSDVACPLCETRHKLVEGAARSRAEGILAVRTSIGEERLREDTRQAVRVLADAPVTRQPDDPILLMHLSDLHFDADTSVAAQLQPLCEDLAHIRRLSGPGIEHLDYLVISGDFTDRGSDKGFEIAYAFVSGLRDMFHLSAERCVLVPGNHDLQYLKESFEWRKGTDWNEVQVQSRKYPERFLCFSEKLFHPFLQKPYPLPAEEQIVITPFWDAGVQFLGFNSCWQIDEYNPKRSGIHPEAVAHALSASRKQEADAREAGRLQGPLLKIAVWHHAVAGPQMMQNVDFLENLKKADVRLILHGDVHEERRHQDRPWEESRLYIVGAGAFGAPAEDRPESTPRLYNLLEIRRDFQGARVHTRQKPRAEGAWDGYYVWPDPAGGNGRVAYYDVLW